MKSAHIVEITTPKGVVLNGLWHGSPKAKKVIIWMHGLTGSAFSMKSLVDVIADSSAAVLTFNNRGFGQINTIKKRRGNKTEYITAGTAHEVFTDCVDDIEGAVRYAKRYGAQRIYIAGHSTGCQKAIYWASRGGKSVAGIVLLGPLSDYAGAKKTLGEVVLRKAVRHAQKLVKAGRPHELMPRALREWFACDAQRFLSLYTPDSKEEIFTYAQPERRARALSGVKLPLLVLLAGADEYGDRPANELAAWFERTIVARHTVAIVPKTQHSFKGGEKRVAKLVKEFMKEC